MREKLPLFNLQGIIFDLDGVLVNSEDLHTRAKAATLVHFGLDDLPSDYEEYKGRTDEYFFQSIKEKNPSWQIDLQSLLAYKTEKFVELYPELKAISGAKDFIQKAAALNLPLAVATSATELSQKFAFKMLGIEELISVVVNASHVSRHKPHPEPYLLAMSKLEILASSTREIASSPLKQMEERAGSRVIVIEDSPSGIRSAKEAGLWVVGLETTFSKDILAQAGADICVESYDQLLQILGWC